MKPEVFTKKPAIFLGICLLYQSPTHNVWLSTFGSIFFSGYPSIEYTYISTGLFPLGVLYTVYLTIILSAYDSTPISGFPGLEL